MFVVWSQRRYILTWWEGFPDRVCCQSCREQRVRWLIHVLCIRGANYDIVFSTTVGLRCKDGVVFGVEKLVTSKLHEEGSNKRIFTVDRHIGIVRVNVVLIRFIVVMGRFVCDACQHNGRKAWVLQWLFLWHQIYSWIVLQLVCYCCWCIGMIVWNVTTLWCVTEVFLPFYSWICDRFSCNTSSARMTRLLLFVMHLIDCYHQC